MKKSLITPIIIGVLILVGAGVYFYTQGGSAPTLGLQAENVAGAGLSEVTILNQIQNIRIDTSLFKDASYQSLQDYSVSIPEQGVGRPNPFEPIPGFTPITSGTVR